MSAPVELTAPLRDRADPVVQEATGGRRATPTPSDASAGPIGSIWARGLLVHLMVLGLIVVAVAGLVGARGAFATDEGSYQLQVRALDAGAWELPSGTEQFDPGGTHYPIAFSTPTARGFVPIPKHPAWPVLGLAVSKVTGIERAYAVLGGVAILIAATTAWLLAAEHDRRWSRSAFWLVGLSPVLVTATLGWAHALVAATTGVAMLGAVRLVRREFAAPSLALLLAGAAGGMLLRSEGTLVAGLLAVVTLIGLWARGRGWRTIGAVAGAHLILVLVALAEGRWVEAITGGGSTTFVARTGEGSSAGFVRDRLSAAWRSGLDPGSLATGRWGLVALAGAMGCGAVVILGRRSSVDGWQIAAGAVVVLGALSLTMGPTDVVPGLVPAWPLALIGLAAVAASLLLRSSGRGTGPEGSPTPLRSRIADVPIELPWAVLYVGAIFATQYADGGAVQWGGRFYAPLTVPVAAIAAGGVVLIARAAAGRASVVVIVALLLVVPTVRGVVAVRSLRASSDRVFAEVADETAGAQVVVTAQQHLPRMMWQYEVPWLVVDDQGPDLARLLGSLSTDGVDDLALVVRPRDRTLVGSALRSATDWRQVRSATTEAGLEVVSLRR